MKLKILRIFLLVIFLLSSSDVMARKKSPVMDKIRHQFDSISLLLEKADQKREAGDVVGARRLYGATIAAYQDFNRKFPNANTEIIKFRIEYCRNQLINLLSDDGGGTAKGGGKQAKKNKVKHQPKATKQKLSRRERKVLTDNINLCRRGAYRNVVANMQKFIKKYPKNGQGYLVLGTALVGLGDFEGATIALKSAVEFSPNSSEAHYNLCQLLVRADDPDFNEARKHYRKALQLGAEPDSDLQIVLNL
jgi:Flp pilus assembly protein TadD